MRLSLIILGAVALWFAAWNGRAQTVTYTDPATTPLPAVAKYYPTSSPWRNAPTIYVLNPQASFALGNLNLKLHGGVWIYVDIQKCPPAPITMTIGPNLLQAGPGAKVANGDLVHVVVAGNCPVDRVFVQKQLRRQLGAERSGLDAGRPRQRLQRQ